MRIAYISLHWPRTKNHGVGKKIAQQVNAWRSHGHDVRFFMHMHETGEDELIPGEAYVYPLKPGAAGLLQRELGRSGAARRMAAGIAAFRPDLIYLRSGMYVYPLHRIFDLAPVVMEINTNDLQEHARLGWPLALYNRLTRAICLRRAAGFVTVSEELARTPEFARFGKLSKVIPNGYDLTGIVPLPAPANRTPRLVFVGTPNYPWHGVDKLVQFARSYPGLQVDIIGYSDLPGGGEPPPNLRLHGYLKSSAYLGVLAQADVAIGSLALHRNQLEEASPLKTREYLAYGLPLVLPYRDVDLYDLECDFLLTIPNREDNLQTHGDVVRQFAYDMRGRRADAAIVVPRIDGTHKEGERVAFFEEVLARLAKDGQRAATEAVR